MKNSKQIYLHIGPPKTGTSTIQSGLVNNNQSLMNAGWYVPRSSNPKVPFFAIHHNIASQITERQSFDRNVGDIKNLLQLIEESDAKQAIISSELFWVSSKQQVYLLSEALSEYFVTVIVYLRRQDLILQSLWAEHSKFPHKGGMQALSQDFRTWVKARIKNRRLGIERDWHDYNEILSNWSAAFGKSQIRIRVLEKSQLQKHLFHDFLATCDVPDPEKFSVPNNTNLTPGPKTLSILRYVMPRIHEMYDDIGMPPYERITPRISRFIIEFGNARGWNDTKIHYINADSHAHIMSHYSKSNRTVAAQYLLNEALFAEPFVDAHFRELDYNDIPMDEILDLIAFVTARLAKFIQAEKS